MFLFDFPPYFGGLGGDPLDGGTIAETATGTSYITCEEVDPATGGVEPYAYQWQIDDGGGFDDIPGETDPLTITVGGLTPSTSYDIRRKVTDDDGTIAYSNELTIETSPQGSLAALRLAAFQSCCC